MLPQLIKSRWVKGLIILGSLCGVIFYIASVVILIIKGNSLFPGGRVVLPCAYIGSMFVLMRDKRLLFALPESAKLDGFFQRIRHDDWKAILDEAIVRDYTPFSDEQSMRIMFGPFRADPEPIESANERSLVTSSVMLADARSMNPFLTLDRIRFASWLIREIKDHPEHLDRVTTEASILLEQAREYHKKANKMAMPRKPSD